MIFILGVALIVCSGYTVVLLAGIGRQNLLLDIALGWFVGSSYLLFSDFLLAFTVGIDSSLAVSLIILAVPISIAASRKTVPLYHLRQSYQNSKTALRNSLSELLLLEKALVLFSLIVLAIIVLHGTSSIIYEEDSLRYRVYHPMLVYMQVLSPLGEVFYNGIWANYLLPFFWGLNGGVEPFYAKQVILLSVVMFYILIFFLPLLQHRKGQAVANVLLVFTTPFFIYHATLAHLDLPLALMFGLGFLFFGSYILGRDNKDIYTAIIFFTIASFIKSNGIFIGGIGVAIVTAHLAYSYLKSKKLPPRSLFFFILPFILHLIFKEYYDPKILKLLGFVQTLPENYPRSADWEATMPASVAFTIKTKGFLSSLFPSGNFGILFYILIASLVIFFRKIFFGKLIWCFFFLFAILAACFYYSTMISSLYIFETIIHRMVLLLSVVSSIFIGFLLSEKPES